MKFTVEFDESELVDAIIAKLPAGGSTATTTETEDDDDFGGTTKEPEGPTLQHVQDAISAAMQKHGKDKLKALVEKHAGVKKVGDIPETKFKTIIDAVAKLK